MVYDSRERQDQAPTVHMSHRSHAVTPTPYPGVAGVGVLLRERGFHERCCTSAAYLADQYEMKRRDFETSVCKHPCAKFEM